MSKRFLTYLTLFVLFCLVWWWRFQAERSQDLKSGMQVKLTGRVASEPILQGAKQRFSIGKFTVIAPSFPYYQYGEKLIITGTLEQQVINSYFSRFSLIYPDIVQFTSDNNQKRGFRAKLLAWRQQLEGQFNQLLPEPEASLLSGVVLGSRREMPADFWQALRATGTLHIIVASGYNISVIAGVVLMVLAGLLNRKIAIILSGFVILLYVLLVGAEPAIVRAGIMAGVALIAGFLGREADGLRVLVFTAGLMLLSQPVLLWDIGFQLSFLATLGLILLVPRLDFLDHLIKPVGLVKDIKETTAAQLMVFPVLLFNFQSFSWLGFLVNPLVLWLVPLIMALGLVQITLGWFWPLAKIVAGLNYVVLHSMVVIIKLAAGFGGGEWRIFGLPASFIFVYYGIICLWVFKTRIKSSRRQNKLK